MSADPKLYDGDFVVTSLDGAQAAGRRGSIDVTGAGGVEVLIRNDGAVLWVNAPEMVLRICGIRGEIKIVDERGK